MRKEYGRSSSCFKRNNQRWIVLFLQLQEKYYDGVLGGDCFGDWREMFEGVEVYFLFYFLVFLRLVPYNFFLR